MNVHLELSVLNPWITPVVEGSVKKTFCGFYCHCLQDPILDRYRSIEINIYLYIYIRFNKYVWFGTHPITLPPMEDDIPFWILTLFWPFLFLFTIYIGKPKTYIYNI